jgi:phosphoglycolate phosphatase
MKNRFDLLIFDWDGTLVDSIDWIALCLQNTADNTRHAKPDYQSAKDVIGLSIDKAIEALFPHATTEEVSELIARYEAAYFSKKLSRDDLFPGAYEMLESLKTLGYHLAIATGKTREGLNEALFATGTMDFFCQTRCADETESKPHPRMLEEIIHSTQISPERSLMIGDSTHDLLMAQNANIASIGVASGAHPLTQLQRHAPLHCFVKITELMPLLV